MRRGSALALGPQQSMAEDEPFSSASAIIRDRSDSVTGQCHGGCGRVDSVERKPAEHDRQACEAQLSQYQINQIMDANEKSRMGIRVQMDTGQPILAYTLSTTAFDYPRE